MAARADAQQAFLDGGDQLAAELVSGDAALSAATETDGVWSLNSGDASVSSMPRHPPKPGATPRSPDGTDRRSPNG